MEIFNNNVGIIIWKKTDRYRCYANNCSIKNGSELDYYMKDKTYENSYRKILENFEDQIIKYDPMNNSNILLKYIPDDAIVELRVQTHMNIQLLSSLSHKIRNPLTNIIGVLSVFDKSKLAGTQKEYISILKRSSYEIIGTMNDIIDIVNSYRGELKLNLERVNLVNLLNQCRDIIANDINNKNLVLKVTIDNGVPKNITVDTIKLKQIIINMLTNSIQHLNIGGIIITVSLFNDNKNECPFEYSKCEEPKYNILFSIKDSGTGMDISKKNLVDSILGINNNSIDIYNYGGFGLTICKYICNLMGGNIWFKTRNCMGTTFYFNIICERADT